MKIRAILFAVFLMALMGCESKEIVNVEDIEKNIVNSVLGEYELLYEVINYDIESSNGNNEKELYFNLNISIKLKPTVVEDIYSFRGMLEAIGIKNPVDITYEFNSLKAMLNVYQYSEQVSEAIANYLLNEYQIWNSQLDIVQGNTLKFKTIFNDTRTDYDIYFWENSTFVEYEPKIYSKTELYTIGFNRMKQYMNELMSSISGNDIDDVNNQSDSVIHESEYTIEQIISNNPDAVVFYDKNFWMNEWTITTIVFLPENREIYFDDHIIYGNFEDCHSNTDSTVMYRDYGVDSIQYDIYYGDEKILDNLNVQYENQISSELYSTLPPLDLYTDFEKRCVKVLYHYRFCDDNPYDLGFALVTISLDNPQLQEVDYYVPKNDGILTAGSSMEIVTPVLSENFIFIYGMPNLHVLDLESGEINTWENMQEVLKPFAEEKYNGIVGDHHPISYDSGYVLLKSIMGMVDMSPNQLVYVIYSEDGTYVDYVNCP